MTTVVGFKTADAVYLGADKRITNGGEIVEASFSKVFRRIDLDMAFGVAGSIRVINVLKYGPLDFSRSDEDEETIFNFTLSLQELLDDLSLLSVDEGVSSLEIGHIAIVYKNEMYSLDHMFSVIRYNSKFFSIGSGSSYAMGALTTLENRKMKPEKMVKDALLVASRWDIQTDNAVEILRLEKE
jgi:ATP-dependent protease HslVU (ClpYQ) peptidase subunit